MLKLSYQIRAHQIKDGEFFTVFLVLDLSTIKIIIKNNWIEVF